MPETPGKRLWPFMQGRLAPRILPGGQMSSQVQVQVLFSVCHPDMQELSFTTSSHMSGYLEEFADTLCPSFHPRCGWGCLKVSPSSRVLLSLSSGF